MKKRNQVNLRMTEEMVNKLESAVLKYKQRSLNQVALEILEDYMDFWIQAEEVKHKFIEQQRQAFASKQSKY
jgi:hypothetical protein